MGLSEEEDNDSDDSGSIALKRKARKEALKKFAETKKGDAEYQNLDWELFDEAELEINSDYDDESSELEGSEYEYEYEDEYYNHHGHHGDGRHKSKTRGGKGGTSRPRIGNRNNTPQAVSVDSSLVDVDKQWTRIFGMLMDNLFGSGQNQQSCAYGPCCYPYPYPYQYPPPCNPSRPRPRRCPPPCSPPCSPPCKKRSRRRREKQCCTSPPVADGCCGMDQVCFSNPDPCISVCKPNAAGGISFSLPGNVQHKTTIKLSHFPKPTQDISYFSGCPPESGFPDALSMFQEQIPNMDMAGMQDECQASNIDVPNMMQGGLNSYGDYVMEDDIQNLLYGQPAAPQPQTVIDEYGNAFVYEY